MKKVILFDLFHTLVLPTRMRQEECDVAGVAYEDWMRYAQDEELMLERAMGRLATPQAIVDAILLRAGIDLDAAKRERILHIRIERMKYALLDVQQVILQGLDALRNTGIRLCLVSNADVIDILCWSQSPLASFFEQAIFSCEVGFVKPQREIYQLASDSMHAQPDECAFVGDGGSQELKGAKEMGMATILAEHFWKCDPLEREARLRYADYAMDDFQKLVTMLSCTMR